MGKVWAAVGAVATVAILGGGYELVLARGQAEIRAAAAHLRSAIGPRGSFTYDRVRVHPFSRSAGLEGVTLRFASGDRYTAARVSVTSGHANGTIALHAATLNASENGDTIVSTASSLDADGVAFSSSGVEQATGLVDTVIGHAVLRSFKFRDQYTDEAIGSIELNRFAATRTGEVTLSGLRVVSSDPANSFRMEIASIGISGVDLTSMLKELDGHLLPSTPTTAARAGINGLPSRNAGYRLIAADRTQLRSILGAGRLSTVHLDLNGLSMRSDDPDFTETFHAFGLDALRASMHLATRYTEANGVLESRGDLVIEGLGTFRAEVDLDHVDIAALAGFRRQPSSLETFLRSPELLSASATLVDGGLRDRVFAYRSAQTGDGLAVAPADVVESISLDSGVMMLPDDAHASLRNFILYGGTLSLVLRPTHPVVIAPLVLAAGTPPSGGAAQLGLSFRAAPEASSATRQVWTPRNSHTFDQEPWTLDVLR